MIRLKIAQAEVIFPLVIKQNVFFLRLHRHLQGPYCLLNIIGSFESLKSKPVLFIKMLTTCAHGLRSPGCNSSFFFPPNSEENHYGLERKCRMAKSTREIVLIETGQGLHVFR